MVQGLLDAIRSHGERGAAVPFSRADDLKRDMLELKAGAFHSNWLDRMVRYMTASEDKFLPRDLTFTPRSLVSVVIYNPTVTLRFGWRGASVECPIPPQYADWNAHNMRVLEYIREYLKPHGYSAANFENITQKLLAVHCGLGRYGRNNICYSDEFGSHIQINTYLSDMPCDDGPWFPLRRMEMCETCHACADACPTGAIDAERRLVNADRCITAFNEREGAFPDWLGKDAHNSIVGCVRCQDCCPANAKRTAVEGPAFTEEETLELIKFDNAADISGPLKEKLLSTGLEPMFMEFFPRNLRAFLERT